MFDDTLGANEGAREVAGLGEDDDAGEDDDGGVDDDPARDEYPKAAAAAAMTTIKPVYLIAHLSRFRVPARRSARRQKPSDLVGGGRRAS